MNNSSKINFSLVSKKEQFVNIDEMCTFTFNYDILKQAIQFLYNHSMNQASVINEILQKPEEFK